VAIAVAALYSLVAFQRGYQAGLRLELDRLGAHVLVVPKGCPYDAASMALHGASWSCYLKQSYLDEVRSVHGIGVAAPIFMAAIFDPTGERTVYVGADTNLLPLRPGWQIRGTFPGTDGGLLIGAEAADRHGWQIGQQILLPGLKGARGTITGILERTHGADDAFIHLRLADAQKRFGHSNELTHILVKLKDPNDLDPVVSQLRGCEAGLSMNVVPLAHLFRTVQSLVNSTRLLLGSVALIALLIAGTGVSNTVLMAVTERRREIGVLRALGASRTHVFSLVWLETLQTCLAGSLVGVILAFLGARSLEAWVRSKLPFSPAATLIGWEWWVAGGCLLVAVVLGTLASLLPAWRAASVPPMVAIRMSGGRA